MKQLLIYHLKVEAPGRGGYCAARARQTIKNALKLSCLDKQGVVSEGRKLTQIVSVEPLFGLI